MEAVGNVDKMSPIPLGDKLFEDDPYLRMYQDEIRRR